MYEFELSELNRRLANIVNLGKVEEIDYQGAIPVVRVKIGEILTAFLPMITSRAGPDQHWWPLEVGEQVVVFAPSGDLAQAVVLGSINQDSYPSTSDSTDVHQVVYSDGAVIEYDRKKHELNAVLPAGAKTNIVSDGGLTFTGDLTVNGNITATEDITDKVRSMAKDREIYNDHDHPGVTPGNGFTQKTLKRQ